MRAQALAHLALDLVLVRQQVVDRRVLVEPLRRGLRPDLRHARDVVGGVAHQREVVDDLLGVHVELDLHAGPVERRVGHGVDQRDAVVHQLRHVLVAGGDDHAHAGVGRAAGERADHVVRLDAGHAQQRQPLRLDGGDQRVDLRAQVVGHRRPVRLVLGEQLVAERLAGRVEYHADQRRVLLLQQLGQHVEHAEHRPGGLAPGVGERWQRVERPVQVGRAVHQHQRARFSHGCRVRCGGACGGGGAGVAVPAVRAGSAGVAGGVVPGAGRTTTSPVFSGKYSGPFNPQPDAATTSAHRLAAAIRFMPCPPRAVSAGRPRPRPP